MKQPHGRAYVLRTGTLIHIGQESTMTGTPIFWTSCLLWSPYVIVQTIIFSSCFFLLLSSFFSSPNLSGRRLDVYHTLAHGVALAHANLECRSEMHCTRLAANTGRKKSPFRHHRTTLSGHIFATKACIDNRKKTC